MRRDGSKKRATPFARRVVTSRCKPVQKTGPMDEALALRAKLKDEGPIASWSRPLANSLMLPICNGGRATLYRSFRGIVLPNRFSVATNICSCFVLIVLRESRKRGIKFYFIVGKYYAQENVCCTLAALFTSLSRRKLSVLLCAT